MKRILISALTVLMMLTVCVAGILPVFAQSVALTADGGDNTTAGVTLPTGVGYIKDESLPTPGADLDTYHTVDTPDDAQPIEDADDFAAMTADGVYYLAADITVSATYAAAFKGQLWGEGHTVTVSVPMFAQLDGATIRDIVIEGAVETSGYAAALALKATAPKLYNVKNYATVTSTATEENAGITGGLIALIGTEDADHVFAGVEGDTVLRYCANYATVSAAGASATGGLIGAAYGYKGTGNGYAAEGYSTFTAEHCYNQGAINAYGHTGGLVGILGDFDQGEKTDTVAYSRIWAKITVNFCTNAGTVTVRGEATPRVGGLFGRVDSSYAEIRNSLNTGAVTSYAHGAGGFAGVFNTFWYTAGNSYNEIIWSQFNTVIDNCVNEGTITAEGAGGFAYANFAATRATNSVNKGDVYGSITNEAGNAGGSCAGGFFAYGQNSSFKIQNCLNEGYVEVSTGSGGAGGFVGNTTASFSLENCTNNGEVYYKNFNDAAGMVGELSAGGNDIWEAIACVNNGKISGTRVGGIFGQIENATGTDGILAMLRAVDCVNTGELISLYENGSYAAAAGIFGKMNNDIKNVELIRCTNYADIAGNSPAGIATGADSTITGSLLIEDCVNYGNISGINHMAGIAYIKPAANNANAFIIRNCRNYGDITNGEDSGGILSTNGGAIPGSFLMENCYNSGDIVDSNRAGGILSAMGAITGTFTVRNCVNEGDVTSTGNYCGGVCGRVDPNAASVFESCLNTGAIVSAKSQVGGIVGYTAGADGKLTLKSCVNLGTVGDAAISTNSGGILGGSADNYYYTSCYNGGTVLSAGRSGGIVGLDQTTTFTDCVNAGTVTGGTVHAIGNVDGDPHTFTTCYNYGTVNGTAGTDAFILPQGVTRVIMPDGTLMVVPATVVDMLMQIYADEYDDPTLVVDAEELTATSVENFKAAIKAKYPVAAIPEGAVAVSTPAEFAAMTAGGVYYLANDLDLTGGEYVETFSGTLYGNGKTVTIKRALFTYVSNVLVRDITFEGTPDPTGAHGGAIANVANGGEITFINVTNNAPIESTTNSAGGLLGYASGATLSAITMQGCINTATVLADTANTKRAGGLFGHVESAPNVSILLTDCLNTGAITSKQVSGGILGWVDGGAGALITNVMNTGEINGEYAGGIAGAFYTTLTLYHAYNTGDIPQGSNVGGIIGAAYNGNFALRHVGNTGAVTATAGGAGAAGMMGLCKVYTYMTLTDSFNTGAIAHNNKNDAAGGIGEFNSQNSALAPIVTIKHFTNTGSVTTTTRAGGVLGQVFSNLDVRMTSCYNSGNLSGSDIGGMVALTNGAANNYSFIDCHNSGNLQSNSRPGGILGSADTVGNLTFINCSNSGKIVSTGNYAGGIAGRSDAQGTKHVIYKNCVNTGDVSSEKQYGGGIMGYAGMGQNPDTGKDVVTTQCLFYNCYNSGNISTKPQPYNADGTAYPSYAGGIAGYTGVNMDFFDCVNEGNVTSGRASGGIVGSSGRGGTALFQCVNTGDIHILDQYSGDKADAVGGILGYQYGQAYAIGCTSSGTISADYQNINDTDEAGKLRGVGAILGYSNNVDTQVRFCVFNGTLDANGAAEYFANYAPGRDLASYDVEANYYGNVATTEMALVYMNDTRTGQCELYGEVEVITLEAIELGTVEAALPPYVLVRDCTGKTYLVASMSADNFKTTLTISHVYNETICSDGYHWQVCLCGEKLAESKEAHNLVYVHDETGHWLQCELCDHVAANTEPSEHGFGQQFDETNHWDECAVCHRQENITEHVANFGYDDDKHWFACDNCDYATTGEDHNHETLNHNGETHWMECICGHIDESTRVEHTYTYTNNGDGTHSVDCACGYHKSDDAHERVQQSDNTAHWDWCTICDALVDGTYVPHDVKYLATAEGHQMGCTGCEYILSPVYEHEFDFRRDEDSHWMECPYCNYTTEDTAHTYDTFAGDATGHRAACECGAVDPNAELLPHNHGGVDNGDGTHAVTCPDCGYATGESEYHVWMAVRVDSYYHGYVCAVCGMVDETRTQVPHRHDLTTLVYDETNHWYACECGDVRNGERIPHTFGEFLHDENGHWKVCECGAISEAGEHIGGQADCMNQAVCTTCNTPYGELIADNHTADCEKVYDQKTQTTHAGYWSQCGKTFEAEAHSFNDEHACSICGYACLHDGTFTYTDGETADNHTKTCDLCGKAEQEACTDGADGSTATCQKKADCIYCLREYGEIADHNYDLNNWSNLVEEGVEYHYHACLTEGCTYTEKDKAACSDGQDNATATCTDKAVCAVCAKEYGTVNEDAHTSTEFKYAINGSRHDKIHVCCDRVAATEAHTVGTAATCTTKAICAVCGFEYGDVDGFAHTGTMVSEITKETHGFRYTCCNFYHIPAVAHTFVDGKCTLVGCDYECAHDAEDIIYVENALAEGATETTHNKVCDHCGKVLEENLAHDFTGEWKTNADQHWKECICGAIAQEDAHSLKWVDLGEGKCHQICETCNYESVAAQDHVLGDYVNTDETNHWKVCQNCQAVVGTTAHNHVATKVEGNTETHNMTCECGHE
ncbi:MAG: hypothetical protein IJY50_07585, partial [Clostridia bacterium]|nr:hypothetical protein [Clostridia bacterium]